MKKVSVLVGFMVVFATVFMGCASTPKEFIQMSFEDWVKAEATFTDHRTEVWDQETGRTAEVESYSFGTLSGPLPKSFVSQLQDADWGEQTDYWFRVRRVTSMTPDPWNETGEWRIVYAEPGKVTYHRKVPPTSVYWTNELPSVLKYFKN
jgi:hypothetical protein